MNCCALQGIVTRRPLVLQLHRLEEGREYAEFAHQPKKRFTDFGMLFNRVFVFFIIFCLARASSFFFSISIMMPTYVHPLVIFCEAAVRKEISDETDRETGRSKAISTVPIYLSIYSPNGEMKFLVASYSHFHSY